MAAMATLSDDVATMVDTGATAIKVKLGAVHTENVAGLEVLRSRFPNLLLRADANRGYRDRTGDIADFAGLDLEWLEEPAAPEDLPRADLGVSLAADESLAEGGDPWSRWRSVPGFRAIVIKPMLVGGVQRTLDLAAEARALGVDAVLTHALDGPIAWTMTAELALALACEHACGLAPHPGLGESGLHLDRLRNWQLVPKHAGLTLGDDLWPRR
jgi:L-alanine-DL-glutamate epimerase-like enolase superfamily enzyme